MTGEIKNISETAIEFAKDIDVDINVLLDAFKLGKTKREPNELRVIKTCVICNKKFSSNLKYCCSTECNVIRIENKKKEISELNKELTHERRKLYKQIENEKIEELKIEEDILEYERELGYVRIKDIKIIDKFI